ncbi:MAG: hypothetical protein Q8K67_06150 [Geothrix sp.]|nr:hypothetical protein [Geothrix sp.]
MTTNSSLAHIALFLTIMAPMPIVAQSLAEQRDERIAAVRDTVDASTVALDACCSPKASTRLQTIRLRPKQFEPVYRASKAIIVTLESGISYRDYSNVIRPLLTELALLDDAVSGPDEHVAYEVYRAAANALIKAGVMWGMELGMGWKDAPTKVVKNAWDSATQALNASNQVYLRNLRRSPSQTSKAPH